MKKLGEGSYCFIKLEGIYMKKNKQIKKTLFTSESVTEGHPDKVCDYISDSVLDACLAQDKYSRVAVETQIKCNKDKLGYHHTVCLLGELTTKAEFAVEDVVRKALLDI